MNLILEGFSFMILGMGSVFLFLILMVFVLKFQGFVLSMLLSKKEPILVTDDKKVHNNDELVAAISVAIDRYKKSKL